MSAQEEQHPATPAKEKQADSVEDVAEKMEGLTVVVNEAAAAAATASGAIDPRDLAVSHPLQHSWTMWYEQPNKGKHDPTNWQGSVKRIATFSTVEEFWSLYNNLIKPSDLPMRTNYKLFKEGIMPMWEDEQNKKGGKWMMQLRHNDKDPELITRAWLYTVLGMIGGAFTDGEEVHGAVVKLRNKANRITLWTKTGSKEEECCRVGREFKEISEMNRKITYHLHEKALEGARGAPAAYEI